MNLADADQYQEAVARLDDVVFAEAVTYVANRVRLGEGAYIVFQPGDATRYQLAVDCGRVMTFSNGEEPRQGERPIRSLNVTFGTTILQTMPIGHAHLMDCGHPWTNAVWYRLFAEIMAALEEAE